MMSLILRLFDNTEIELLEATFNKHYVAHCDNSTDYQELRNKLTTEALSEIKIYENDTEVAHLINLTLNGAQEVINGDGTITAHFYLSGGENATTKYAEAGKILLGEDEEELGESL